MLLEALKEENMITQTSDELTRTLNDITQQSITFGNGIAKISTSPSSTSTTTTVMASNITTTTPSSERRESIISLKSGNAKTEKDKYNSKERRNSRYYVRNADKEAIQLRANSLKRAINTVMEYSGLYDHKPKHGSRKHSLAALNIPTNINQSPCLNESQTTPPPSIIIEPNNTQAHATITTTTSTDGTVITNLSPLPDQRRSSMDEYFFNSVSLPVPKQFADAASRRSSNAPEAIKEEEGNGQLISSDNNKIETEYNYDVGYLCGTNEIDCESAVPIEVYERNLLRAANIQQSTTIVEKDSSKGDDLYVSMKATIIAVNTLQIPTIQMSEVDMMERTLTVTNENVYTSDNMTIIDTDHVVRFE